MQDLYNWEIKNKFPEADFWMQNKGTADTVGTITREYRECLTGIKCPAVILPAYGYYFCQHLHQSGVWKPHTCMALISWQTIRISDIRMIFKEISRSYRAQHEARFKNFTPVKREESLFADEVLLVECKELFVPQPVAS